MNPEFIDNMSWEMAEVYGAITDQILINLAHYFPYYKNIDELPRSSFTYQAAMLAQMGKVNQQTVDIIRRGLGDADGALKNVLEQAIIDSVRKSEKGLVKAVKKGILSPPTKPIVSANQMRAFQLYYQQAANKLNLVNTVMLESTRQAYQGAVSDMVSEMSLMESMNRLQIGMDTAAGETVTGVSAMNQAVKHATDRMKEAGITGFIDHGGHRWSAEAYAAMDIRTTVANTARAAVWETNESFGNDLYSVSWHNGARPLCYDWQNRVISATDNARTVVDLDGNEIHVWAQSETSYGEPAGLFGVNCKHYPTPFIPGVSLIRGEPQNPEDNARTYAESQQQRGLERKIREEKRDYMMLKAQNAPEELLDAQRLKIKSTDAQIEEFCAETGRARHKDREAVYTKREFPSAKTYNPATFAQEQKDLIDGFFSVGGAQVEREFGQLVPNVPLVPGVPVVPGKNVAKKATKLTPQPDTMKYGNVFDNMGYRPAQIKQFEDAKQTLAKAPRKAREAWAKVSGKLRPPYVDSSNSGAFYRSATGRVHFKTFKKAFEETTYQRKNACFFHEYGHNIDDLLGGGGWDKRISATYLNKAGETLQQVIQRECDDALKSFYLHEHGVKDAYEAVKAAQNGTGGMGFGSYMRQMLRGTMPAEEYRAIRGTLLDVANDDDSVWRPLVDKWLKPQFETELTGMYHSVVNGTEFKGWVEKTYTRYERTDVSDIFEEYMVKTFGKSFEYPFGVGHGYNYWDGSRHIASSEGFAEMYSAYVTAPDSLETIKQFFPEAFSMFESMLGGIT